MPEGGYHANDPTAQRLGQAAGDGQIPKRGDTEQGEYQQAPPPHGPHFDQGGEENVEPGQQTHDPCLRQQGGQRPEGGGDALAPRNRLNTPAAWPSTGAAITRRRAATGDPEGPWPGKRVQIPSGDPAAGRERPGAPAEAEHIGCPRVVVVAVPADIPLAQELWHQLAEHHAPQEKFSPDPEQPEQIILHCNSPHFPQYLLPPAG